MPVYWDERAGSPVVLDKLLLRHLPGGLLVAVRSASIVVVVGEPLPQEARGGGQRGDHWAPEQLGWEDQVRAPPPVSSHALDAAQSGAEVR